MRKKYNLNKLIATFFFSGYLPKIPGTWGSLATLILWLLFPIKSLTINIIIIVFLFIVGVIVSDSLEKKSGIKDPSFIVIDEVVGMWLTLTFIPIAARQDYLQIILAFILFRFFDITKIFPINKIEKIKGGLGIMADDILAGLFAGICLLFINTVL